MDTLCFVDGDPANPRNWPAYQKWAIVAAIVPIDLTVSWAASGFSPAAESLASDFSLSKTQSTLGLSLYVLGLALGPLLLAPLSESYGRSSVYIGSYGVFLTLLLGTALAEDFTGFLVLRLMSGFFSSVTVANFGGTIADLWPHDETGPAMSLFLWAATFGSSSGFLVMTFVAETQGWRMVFWALLAICGAFWIVLILTLKETRHSTILRRRAENQILWYGRQYVHPGPACCLEPPRPLKRRKQYGLAIFRPIRFLFTEAIVAFAALYNGCLYGLSFLFNGVFVMVFGQGGRGFDTIGVGLCFLGIMVGISIGPITNLWQERYYRREVEDAPGASLPEARVQLSMMAAIVHPLSLLWFSWGTIPEVHWIVPVIASAFWGWSFYTLILMTYTYTEDSYGVYSASALAGIGLVRNLAGAGFPLLTEQLLSGKSFCWGGTALSGLAWVLAPIPFVLLFYGPTLRHLSPWASLELESLVQPDESDNQSEG